MHWAERDRVRAEAAQVCGTELERQGLWLGWGCAAAEDTQPSSETPRERKTESGRGAGEGRGAERGGGERQRARRERSGGSRAEGRGASGAPSRSAPSGADGGEARRPQRSAGWRGSGPPPGTARWNPPGGRPPARRQVSSKLSPGWLRCCPLPKPPNLRRVAEPRGASRKRGERGWGSR